MDPDVRVTARRELEEEIGATDIRLTSLGDLYPDAGMDSSTVTFFHASIGSFGKPELHEAITDIMPTPVPELERMIRDGELKDGFLLPLRPGQGQEPHVNRARLAGRHDRAWATP